MGGLTGPQAATGPRQSEVAQGSMCGRGVVKQWPVVGVEVAAVAAAAGAISPLLCSCSSRRIQGGGCPCAAVAVVVFGEEVAPVRL